MKPVSMSDSDVPAFELRDLTKRFGDVVALNRVSVSVPRGSVVGLIGKNGSGKTTMIRHVVGLLLPTSGECITLGTSARELGDAQLARIGVVHHEGSYLYWMTAEQQIRYVSSFYPTWDKDLERRLVKELELPLRRRVAALSSGDAQKLGLILAVAHHPVLLLLDEPISGLDPIARERTLRFLLELIRTDESTIVISSHMLHDVQSIVDRVVCLDAGHICAAEPLDDLLERWAEWIVTARGPLPQAFDEPFIVAQHVNGRRAQLVVVNAAEQLSRFREQHGVEVEVNPVNLERIFPHLVQRT
jgi:ABC-2 type transport system ATP-binding protein